MSVSLAKSTDANTYGRHSLDSRRRFWGARINARTTVRMGDRIRAGHVAGQHRTS